MNLNYCLPDDISDLIKNEIRDEKIQYCIPFDVDKDGAFIDSWFIITRTKIVKVLNKQVDVHSINKAKDYKVEGYTGQGVLICTINNDKTILCRFSMSHVKRYSYIAHALNDLREKGVTHVNSEESENNVCPKCGRMIPVDIKTCPACIKKANVFKKVFGIAKKYWKEFLGAFIITWTITFVSIIQPVIYRKITDEYITVGNDDLRGFLVLIIALVVTGIGGGLLTIVRGRLTTAAGNGFSKELRDLVYAKIQMLSLGYVNNRKTGDLFNRITQDTNRIAGFLVLHAPDGFNQVLTLIWILIIMLVINWKMALLVLFPLPIVLLINRRIWSFIRTIFRKQHRQWDKTNSMLQDILSGIRVVKAFGQEENAINRFKKENRKFSDMAIRNEAHWVTIFPFTFFLVGLGTYPVIYLGGSLVLEDTMKLGELVQVTIYATMMYAHLNFLTFFPRMMADTATSLERVFDVIDQEVRIDEIDNPVKHEIKGNVIFENVTFGYQSHIPILEDINVEIKQGEMIGLVGHSGAGKSTFINLLMRLYDVDSGKILIDGIDIRDFSKAYYSEQLGIVLQETFLFSGTIIENVRYSKPKATLDEVIRACKIANAHDFIIKFTDGYDTKVGERGHRLSGGERQRIAIARAILSNPRILILDEATSALDTHVEQEIQEALERLIKGRTTFAIAHRLSTLKNADRLIVIEEGKVAECGSHDELMLSKGIYYELVKAQDVKMLPDDV